jgi:hypothetical protein
VLGGTTSFCLSFHQGLLGRSAASQLDEPPDLSCQDGTGQHPADGCQLSPKQRRFYYETGFAVFPACLQTTSMGATTSELEWWSRDGQTGRSLDATATSFG